LSRAKKQKLKMDEQVNSPVPVRDANRSCPSLGLVDDADTSSGFPSNWNYCHHSRPIQSPALKHQEEFCLGGKYGECPVFLSRQAAPLPKQVRGPGIRIQRNSLRKKLVAGMAVLGVVLLAGWGIFAVSGIGKTPQVSFATALSTATRKPLPTMTVSPVLTYTMTVPALPVSDTIADTPAYTPTRYRTATPSGTPSQLDVLIGTDYKFVIHEVQTGEDLVSLAAEHNTSVEAIKAVNYGLSTTAWVDTLLVIPVGFTDFSSLPSFVVYQVKPEEIGMSVESMAKRLRVKPLDLKYYNGWTSPGDRPLVGDLLLVPRPRPMQ
jgi:hypothetical protein